jgi:hypothetical protein
LLQARKPGLELRDDEQGMIPTLEDHVDEPPDGS